MYNTIHEFLCDKLKDTKKNVLPLIFDDLPIILSISSKILQLVSFIFKLTSLSPFGLSSSYSYIYKMKQ